LHDKTLPKTPQSIREMNSDSRLLANVDDFSNKIADIINVPVGVVFSAAPRTTMAAARIMRARQAVLARESGALLARCGAST
jgi:hypothetical protein